MIMGGGFRVWDHNNAVIQILKDTDSGALGRRVLQSCRFRLSLMRLSRAALAPNDDNSYDEVPVAQIDSNSSPLTREPSMLTSSPTADGAMRSLPRNGTDASLTARGSGSLGLGANGGASSGLASSLSSKTANGGTSSGLTSSGSSKAANGGTSSGATSWIRKTVSLALPPGLKHHLEAQRAAHAMQLRKGEITREAFVCMVEEKFGYLKLPTEHLNAMFNCMDADDSGTVTTPEFTSYMMANAPHDLVHHFSKHAKMFTH